ncbi:hypothetical protein [Hyalangium gracile]|uniref:hypothetical protein n=1 Tax=Hyalangium gracile TaxID=394092 RepID=UPI001CCD09D4|nr:hypothetical protein [Hyalangium gracile]
MSLGLDVIQNAIARPPSGAPLKRNAPSGVRVRVELVVLAAAGAPAPVEPEKGRFHLAPGGTFHVRVMLSPAGLEEADAVDFAEAESLSLSWDGPKGLQLQTETASLVPSELDSGLATREFWLKTAPDAQGVQGRLSLHRATRAPHQVRSLELRIEKAGRVLPEALRDKILVDLEEAPEDPEATAFLHIEATDQTLRLHWFPSEDPSSGPISVLEPPRNLLDPPGPPDTRKLLYTVQNFFRRQCGRLTAWLKERLKARSDVTLIIQEYAETRVPWEMLELPSTQGRRVVPTPIGALIKVVRWLKTMDQEEGEHLPLRMGRQTWSGRAMSYVAEKELEQAAQELEALQGCHERFDDIELLGQELQDDSSSLAMLFVASHGQSPEDEPDPEAPEHVLTQLILNLPTFIQKERPLIFINACHSGLLLRDDYGVSGLPERLLGTFAGAYLGVMGRIEEGIAASVGARILQAARAEGGVCIPEELRRVRKEAFEKLNVNDPESRRAYVSTFMYVFYGTPEAYLKLEPAGAPLG